VRHLPLMALLAVLIATAPLSGQDLDAYRALARRFAQGEVDGAAAELATWTPERELDAVDDLIRQKPSADPQEEARKQFEAAAVLEADQAFRAMRASGPQAGEFHLDAGRRLLRALHTWPRTEIEAFERHWYLAVGATLTTHGALDRAWVDIDAGLHMFPADARLRLAAGIIAEAGLAFGVQTVAVPGSYETLRTLGGRRTTVARTISLPKPEQDYRTALELDGTLVEARLRLGRLLTLKGDHARAATELTRVVTDTTEPDMIFLGHLFLGRLRLSDGDLTMAQVEFDAARASHPRWPTSYIALSELADRRGDPSAALGYVEAMETLERERHRGGGVDDDPWRSYSPGGGRLATLAVQWLMQEIRP